MYSCGIGGKFHRFCVNDILFVQLFGENLVHSGNKSMGPPAYVDPYELLEAESKIPLVPFDRAPEPALSTKNDVASTTDSTAPTE